MSQLKAYFEDYAANHRHPMNKVTHYLGIPLIVMTLFGMLSHWVILPQLMTETVLGFQLQLDGGILIWLLASLWYLKLEWRLGLPFSGILLLLYYVSLQFSFSLLVLGFILGWIFQGIGHAIYEKARPAFLTNILHLLVGPLWIFARAVGYLKKQ